MLTDFSPQLIERLQRYFLNRFKKTLTSEQANQYLHSYAELFGLFWDDDPPPDQLSPP
jgi:hypothetical protein